MNVYRSPGRRSNSPDRKSKAKSSRPAHGLKNSTRNIRVGVLNIPSFYRDFNGASNGEEDFKSTARDVPESARQIQAPAAASICWSSTLREQRRRSA